MATNENRASIMTSGSGDTEGRNGEQKKNIWTSMLESVASGKRLPEKNLLVLGKLTYGPGLEDVRALTRSACRWHARNAAGLHGVAFEHRVETQSG